MRSLLIGLSWLMLCLLSPMAAHAAETRHDAVIDGVRLAYWTSRPIRPDDVPVLFLHGGPGYNSYSFRKSAGVALDRRWPMVYLDERGSGASERPWNNAYSIDLMVRDIEGLRRTLGVKRMVVMGHSFGGILAAEYAVRYRAHVAGLVLVDAAVDLPAAMGVWVRTLKSAYPKAYAAAMAGPAGKALRKVPADDTCALSKARMALVGAALQTLPDPQAFRDLQQFHNKAALAEQKRLDAQSGYRNTGQVGAALFGAGGTLLCYRVSRPSALDMPVLIMVGAHDRAVGVAPQRRLASELKHARLVVFPDSAHFAYEEQPAAFLRALDGFLATIH